MNKAYVLAHDDNEYEVFSSSNPIDVYQDHNVIIFSDGEKDDVRVPSWSFKSHRIVDAGNTDYFEPNDLVEQPQKVYRISLRYATDLVNYDFRTKPEVRVVELPMSFIINGDGQTIQVIVHENLWFIQSGWIDV